MRDAERICFQEGPIQPCSISGAPRVRENIYSRLKMAEDCSFPGWLPSVDSGHWLPTTVCWVRSWDCLGMLRDSPWLTDEGFHLHREGRAVWLLMRRPLVRLRSRQLAFRNITIPTSTLLSTFCDTFLGSLVLINWLWERKWRTNSFSSFRIWVLGNHFFLQSALKGKPVCSGSTLADSFPRHKLVVLSLYLWLLHGSPMHDYGGKEVLQIIHQVIWGSNLWKKVQGILLYMQISLKRKFNYPGACRDNFLVSGKGQTIQNTFLAFGYWLDSHWGLLHFFNLHLC